MPEWVDVCALALRLNVMPSVVDNEPVYWLDRLNEYLYHIGKNHDKAPNRA